MNVAGVRLIKKLEGGFYFLCQWRFVLKSFVEYLSYNLVLNIVPVNDHTPQFNPTTINFELQEVSS